MKSAFTLIELLVVIAIMGILMALLAPSLERANEKARITVCAQNLHQMAVGFNAYANDSQGMIPVGPSSPSALMPSRPWNTIGSHQVQIGKTPNGLGVMYAGGWLNDPRCFVCPSDDDKTLKGSIKSQLLAGQDVYGSYAYRQLDQRNLPALNWAALNGMGNPAKALVLDWQSEGPAPYAHDSHDSGEFLNVLYADGHIQNFPGEDHALGGEAKDYLGMPGSYVKRLDQVWVSADWAEEHPVGTAPQLP